jgi:N-acetylmuramoyl-L-alanine amidase
MDQRVRFLVIHYTAEDFHNALNTLTDEHVSAHYLIPAQPPLENGKPVAWQLVPENMRAWHAGASGWRGRTNLNDTSIGIELENKGYSTTLLGKKFYPFPPAQIDLLAELSKGIVARYQIEPRNVVAHSDIAPQRKDDPGAFIPVATDGGAGDWCLAGCGAGQPFSGGQKSAAAGRSGASSEFAETVRLYRDGKHDA